jgi:hypothetical protein
VTCEKLLKDEKRCNELLSQTVSVYNRYVPDNFKNVRQFNKKDLKYMTMPLTKTVQKK